MFALSFPSHSWNPPLIFVFYFVMNCVALVYRLLFYSSTVPEPCMCIHEPCMCTGHNVAIMLLKTIAIVTNTHAEVFKRPGHQPSSARSIVRTGTGIIWYLVYCYLEIILSFSSLLGKSSNCFPY